MHHLATSILVCDTAINSRVTNYCLMLPTNLCLRASVFIYKIIWGGGILGMPVVLDLPCQLDSLLFALTETLD